MIVEVTHNSLNYPLLMWAAAVNEIIFMTSYESGFVLHSYSENRIGFYSTQWDMSQLEVFNGSMYLSNN